MKAFKRWLTKYYRKLLATFLGSYYNSIETMPIGKFTKCLSGDLSHVSKGKYYTIAGVKKAWANVFNQHVKAHGLPEVYVQYMAKMEKALAFYAEAYSGKKWQVVKARVYEAEAATLIAGEGEKIETTCARISKYMGFPVKANECSVSEFYNYVAIMNPS